MRKSVLIGLLSSLFFTSTFVINRSMNLSGGSFLWSASLRYLLCIFLMLPLLKKGSLNKIKSSIYKNPVYWLVYSTIGFGFFYLRLAASSIYGESWMVASLWQLTIVFGILLSPLTGHKIPIKPLLLSFIIILGIVLLQLDNIKNTNIKDSLIILLLMTISAISYPLGNRKMMQLVADDLTTTERVYGMTIMSAPFWIVVSLIALTTHGLPSSNQFIQVILVTIFSSIIATILFFKATNMERNNATGLALVESTIAAQVPLSLITGVLILGDRIPSGIGLFGILFIIIGIILSTVIKDSSEKAKSKNSKNI